MNTTFWAKSTLIAVAAEWFALESAVSSSVVWICVKGCLPFLAILSLSTPSLAEDDSPNSVANAQFSLSCQTDVGMRLKRKGPSWARNPQWTAEKIGRTLNFEFERIPSSDGRHADCVSYLTHLEGLKTELAKPETDLGRLFPPIAACYDVHEGVKKIEQTPCREYWRMGKSGKPEVWRVNCLDTYIASPLGNFQFSTLDELWNVDLAGGDLTIGHAVGHCGRPAYE